MAEGEDWQDRISSQNIEKTDKSSSAGSANSEGGLGRIASRAGQKIRKN